MKCNTCGLETNNNICPFCGNDPNIKAEFDFNNLFKEEKIDISFNMRNILNDVDFRNEYENIKVEDADISKQYLGKDLSEANLEKIKIINDYYRKSIELYKTKQKKNLELFDVPMLQSHVASFNEIVNNCNKFSKMTTDASLQKELSETIKLYNKEIHYIKKYFILPRYDEQGLLNRSKIVKLLLDVATTIIMYMILLYTGAIDIISKPMLWLSEYWGPVDNETKKIAINYCISILSSIYTSEIFFQIFLNLTIKNKNFQVDKNKKYDIHIAVAVLGFILSFYNPVIFVIYTILFFGYLLFKTIKCIMVDKWNIESIIEKVAISGLTFYMLCQTFKNIIPAIQSGIGAGTILFGTATIFFTFLSIIGVISLFTLIVNWKFYKKLGYEGWVSLIPLYNSAKLFEAVYGKWTKMFLLLIPFYNIYFLIKTNIILCKKFNKSAGFIVGYFLLPLIFHPILAFDKSQFNK